MDNTDLLLHEIFTSTTLTKRQKIFNAEEILTKKLEVAHPNLEDYFQLAVVVLEEPEVDFIKSIECMEKVLAYDKTNKDAAIFLSWLQYFNRGYVNSDTIAILNNLLKDVEIDPLSKSLIYLAKSWSDEIDENQRHSLLEKSIKYNDTYVHNYLELASIYRGQDNLERERCMNLKALSNVEEIYLVDQSFDLAAVAPYLGQGFKGVVNGSIHNVPTYNRFKSVSILRSVMDSNTIKDLLECLIR